MIKAQFRAQMASSLNKEGILTQSLDKYVSCFDLLNWDALQSDLKLILLDDKLMHIKHFKKSCKKAELVQKL